MGGVKEQIKAVTGGMDLDTLNPVADAPKCKTPALFVHGIEDDFVEMTNSEKNKTAWGGESDLVYCEGSHNDERPEDVINQAVAFLKKHLS